MRMAVVIAQWRDEVGKQWETARGRAQDGGGLHHLEGSPCLARLTS
jgi:hypothetical protein